MTSGVSDMLSCLLCAFYLTLSSAVCSKVSDSCLPHASFVPAYAKLAYEFLMLFEQALSNLQ